MAYPPFKNQPKIIKVKGTLLQEIVEFIWKRFCLGGYVVRFVWKRRLKDSRRGVLFFK
jgi:hypothetical protein